MARPAVACALALTLLAPVAGCDDATGRLAFASERARPYLAPFESFDRWARRANQTEVVVRDRESLTETAFAPIRSDRGVLAAWIDYEPQRRPNLALPDSVEMPDMPWTEVRDARLGALRVAAPDRCPIAVPKWWRGPVAGGCVLISRQRADAIDGRVTVTVAFLPAS